MTAGLALVGFTLAGLLSAALLAQSRRVPGPPIAEASVAAVLVANVTTTATPEPAPWVLTAAFVAWLVALTVFPDGRPRPTWMGWALLASVAALLVALAVPAFEPVRGPVFAIGFFAGCATQVWRYQRRSTIAERQAAKWLIAGLVPAVTVFLGLGVVASTTSLGTDAFDSSWYAAVSAVGIWLVPVGAAAGLLLGERGRIDDVLHAEIVVCSTAIVVAWSYFASLAPLGETAAAAAAAVLVVPTHRVTSRMATRLVYGRDVAATLPALSRRLESTVVAEDVATVVARTIADGLAVPYVAVRLSDGKLDAATGVPPPAVQLEQFTVAYLGRLVAAIDVAPRAAEVALHRRDRSAVEALAAHAGPALHGAGVLRDLAAARDRIAGAREDERRRVRRDLHDDLAPTLAGIGLRAAAAETMNGSDPERVAQLHRDIQEGIHAAIAQIREIAHDLRPSLLDECGLEAALRHRLASHEDDALAVTLTVTDLPASMPADIELAALRIVQEAVTNVRRHAQAHHCQIAVAAATDQLHVSVTDDGRGLPDDHRPNVGLVSLEERARRVGGVLSVGCGDPGGTTVTAVLPLRGSTSP